MDDSDAPKIVIDGQEMDASSLLASDPQTLGLFEAASVDDVALLPRAPQGVRVHYPSGETVAAEVVYEGFMNFAHRWRIIRPSPIRPGRDERVTIENLPAFTAVHFDMGWD